MQEHRKGGIQGEKGVAMKVKCIKAIHIDLTLGQIYDVIKIENRFGRDYYRIVDDSGEDYVYGASCFELVEA